VIAVAECRDAIGAAIVVSIQGGDVRAADTRRPRTSSASWRDGEKSRSRCLTSAPVSRFVERHPVLVFTFPRRSRCPPHGVPRRLHALHERALGVCSSLTSPGVRRPRNFRRAFVEDDASGNAPVLTVYYTGLATRSSYSSASPWPSC